MPPPPNTTAGGGTLEKMTMGALMGTGVGLTIGFIFGMTSIVRAGPGPRGSIATLATYMGSSAATFGFFMSIGSVIRTDSPHGLPESYRTRSRLLAESPVRSAWRRNEPVEVKAKEVSW
ncbi:reactive mitochondrial oxygen species modulator 1-domain-containing protein [Papiliotrema laurentii]|uniref:Reactive mitochondrial oxygen species modulator 1-domain-containing protein n=1 Tax=Papiliotrema laurentii TaxID=5418 RepID=A0AAD9FQK0_PAPLA|nr:reactive mitochondrial oxygen species modulator 1-domain-containing protein [Papiliotrema laurentii]